MARDLLTNPFVWNDYSIDVHITIFVASFSFLDTSRHFLPIVTFPMLSSSPFLQTILVLCFARNTLIVCNVQALESNAYLA